MKQINHKTEYHKRLKELMDQYVKLIYQLTRKYPKEELYGLTSQHRRASVSIILNYIEGYARQRKALIKQFLGISYGSLRESEYLSYLSFQLNYISKANFDKLVVLEKEIGRMLWGILVKI